MTPETAGLLNPSLLLHAKLLLMVGIANGIPIITNKALGYRWNYPLDGGARFFDRRPLFGRSKTLRGVLFALGLTPLAALLLGLTAWDGLIIAVFAMIGDLISSFAKRRLGLTSSSQALGLDQIPESLFPLLVIQGKFNLHTTEIAWMVLLFLVLELAFSRVLYRLHWRDQPY